MLLTIFFFIVNAATCSFLIVLFKSVNWRAVFCKWDCSLIFQGFATGHLSRLGASTGSAGWPHPSIPSIHVLTLIQVWFIGAAENSLSRKSPLCPPCSSGRSMRHFQASQEIWSPECVLGRPQGLLPVPHAWNTLPRRHHGGILFGCPNHLTLLQKLTTCHDGVDCIFKFVTGGVKWPWVKKQNKIDWPLCRHGDQAIKWHGPGTGLPGCHSRSRSGSFNTLDPVRHNLKVLMGLPSTHRSSVYCGLAAGQVQSHLWHN